jgi:uncharacterized protein (TIGR04255 family)
VTRPIDLPDFDNPPVVEVLLSVQFDKLSGLKAPHVGLLWSQFEHDFPRTEEHPPLDPVFEAFESPVAASFNVEVVRGLPTPRVWFLNPSGGELIQVQADRFVHNWRKVGEGDQYPRYERIRERFMEELRLFQSFLAERNLGELSVNQCEIVYVNHLLVGAGWENWGEAEKVVKVWRGGAGEFLPMPEDVRLQVRYIIEREQVSVGRLHVSLMPALRNEDQSPMFAMNLTARGRPPSPSIEGAMEFLDLGRDWIVRGFTDLTTSNMHNIWRRQT